jgi:hypothetical protein
MIYFILTIIIVLIISFIVFRKSNNINEIPIQTEVAKAIQGAQNAIQGATQEAQYAMQSRLQ